MKTIKILFPLTLALASGTGVGCSRLTTTTAGAAGGAFVGHKLSGGSAIGTAFGAASGTLAVQGAWALKERAQQRAFEDGYLRGRADAVKSNYFRLQEPPNRNTASYRLLNLTIPARHEGGALLEPQTTTIVIAE